jgi:hypothetical protein
MNAAFWRIPLQDRQTWAFMFFQLSPLMVAPNFVCGLVHSRLYLSSHSVLVLRRSYCAGFLHLYVFFTWIHWNKWGCLALGRPSQHPWLSPRGGRMYLINSPACVKVASNVWLCYSLYRVTFGWAVQQKGGECCGPYVQWTAFLQQVHTPICQHDRLGKRSHLSF